MKNSLEIRKTIETVSNIPTLPIVVEKLTKLLQDPKTSAEDVGKAITSDQVLASKVLKLVNSAFYGFPGKISTVTHAVVILGFSTVKNIVLTASIFNAFGKKITENSFDIEKFWLHSIACSAAAQCISRHVGHIDKEECFIAGLIHDVGKVVMCNFLPVEFQAVLKDREQRNCLLYQSENDILHITHEDIGGIICERWNLPKTLQSAVKRHHFKGTEKDFSIVDGIVHAADIFVRALDYGNGGDNKIPIMSECVWRNLGLKEIELTTLLHDISEEVEKASVFMQVLNS